MTERLLTTRQVADILGVSTETVLRWQRAGKLRGYRLATGVLRFREGELEDWIAGCAQMPVDAIPAEAYPQRRA